MKVKKIYELKLTKEELDFIFSISYSFVDAGINEFKNTESDIKDMDVASKICCKAIEVLRKEMLKNEHKRLYERKHQSKTCN